MKSSTSKIIATSLLVGTFAVVNIVFASTTIGTDISTAGNLSVGSTTEMGNIASLDPFLSSYITPGQNDFILAGFQSNDALFLGDGTKGNDSPNPLGVAALGHLVVGAGFYSDAAVNPSMGETATGDNASQFLVGNNGAGTLTTASAIQIQPTFNNGTLVNNIGLEVQDQTAGTNNWAIKTGLGHVQFMDKVGIGTDPSDPFDIYSNFSTPGDYDYQNNFSSYLGYSGSAPLTDLVAISSGGDNTGVGTITNVTNLELNGYQSNQGGTIINQYALKIDDINSATNNFAIKTGLGKVSFGDKVGIGTTTPATQLQVTSGASATTTVTIGSLGLTSSKGCVNMNQADGSPGSFYLAGGVMKVENNYCR